VNSVAAADHRSSEAVAGRIDRACVPLHGSPTDYDDLLDAVGDRSVVLLGEATHGTHEFYRERARITKRLIEERGFAGVAVEGDWPDAYRVHRYVTGSSDDCDADSALSDFTRFPSWMWRNVDVVEFIEWLRQRNNAIIAKDRVGFYGLDLYSLHASIEAVLGYLDRFDPAAATRARERYACFDRVDRDGQAYGARARFGAYASCENEVVTQLGELRANTAAYLARDGWVGRDELFYASQNARLVLDAEQYYREMYRAEVSSWNLRDRHMAETIKALRDHLAHDRPSAKLVIWEHNSHVGDARSTSMSRRGELNVGQVMRQVYGHENVLLVGLTTYAGTVTAASTWGGPAERKVVRRALPGSVEALFHEVGHPRFLLRTRLDDAVASDLRETRLERAIGVIYRPETELISHYFETHLADQFDVVIHIDHTHALEPLERTSLWDEGEPAETYPFGL
jgi:erythromycin esterase-like protein